MRDQCVGTQCHWMVKYGPSKDSYVCIRYDKKKDYTCKFQYSQVIYICLYIYIYIYVFIYIYMYLYIYIYF